MEEVLPGAPEIPGAPRTVPALHGQGVGPDPGSLHHPSPAREIPRQPPTSPQPTYPLPLSPTPLTWDLGRGRLPSTGAT